jgi:hypothetical protein
MEKIKFIENQKLLKILKEDKTIKFKSVCLAISISGLMYIFHYETRIRKIPFPFQGITIYSFYKGILYILIRNKIK